MSDATGGRLGNTTGGRLGNARDVWDDWIDGKLDRRRRENRLRRLTALSPENGIVARLGGKSLVLFSSNDYLGLACHPDVTEAVAQAARQRGMGPRGSALVCGYSDLHEALEVELAALKAAESALLFPTGYAANIATLSALADSDLAIFSDRLNHASIIDGCRLAAHAGAEIQVYRHRDAAHLEEQLARCERPRRLIVTEGLFSMDGDLAPLSELVALKNRFGARLMVDDAHGTLVLGASGGGCAEAQGVESDVDIHVGTLSKAFGAQGGFVATNDMLRNWLLNSGRAFVYSTALPLPIVAAAREALAVRRREPQRVVRLQRRIASLSEALNQAAETPIVSLELGTDGAALGAAEELLAAGLYVPAIRPPTVPEGTARLRISVSAEHSRADVERLCRVLRRFTVDGDTLTTYNRNNPGFQTH